MKLLELDAGVHQLPTIEEPTLIRSIARNPWDAIIRPLDPDLPAVNVYANVMLQGVTIQGGRWGIKGHTDKPASITIDNCWVVENLTSGIFTPNPLLVIRSLFEYNGASRQFNHGIYAQGPTTISRSIIWGNSGYQITAEGVSLMLDRCLINGERGIHFDRKTEHTTVSRCTIGGKHTFSDNFPAMDDTNIFIEAADEERPWWQVHPSRRLYWLAERAKDWDGRGCYDYNARFEPDPGNDYAIAHAKTLWSSGQMYARDGSWSNHERKQPHFPGDVYGSEAAVDAAEKKT